MSDPHGDRVDPRLDRVLERAAATERGRPSPDPERMLARLRPHLRPRSIPAERTGGWSSLAHASASLAAAGVLAAILFLVFRHNPDPVGPETGSAAQPPVEAEDDAFVVENLEAFERLAEVLAGDNGGEIEAVEVCDDLDLIADTDLDALLAGLLEETG